MLYRDVMHDLDGEIVSVGGTTWSVTTSTMSRLSVRSGSRGPSATGSSENGLIRNQKRARYATIT
ncbi:MAG: hypothetical protein ACI88S_001039 [Ilumatobacter sp.]|jgi:hypothetical protein